MDMQLGYTPLIVDECRHQGALRNQAAYILATAYWETARTMRPIRERGSEAYLEDKPYYPWIGRGFVQLTWEENYARAGQKLGQDFTSNPDAVMEPEYAVQILVAGMLEGWFTGKKLGEFVTLQRSDFRRARLVVNGTDRAGEIADLARKYDAELLAMGYGVASQEKEMAEKAPVPAGRVSREIRRSVLMPAVGFFIAQTGFLSVDWDMMTLTVDLTAFAEEFGWTAAAVASGGGSLWWWKLAKRVGGAL